MTSRRLYRDPLGVRLRDLATMLAPTTIKTTLQDNTLTADHGTYTVQVEVVPATVQETDMGPIKAVVLVNTEIPKPIRELLGSGLPGMTAMCNKYAALASVYEDGDSLRIGSRLTIYEAEDAWDTLHLPLLAFTVMLGAEPILGGLRRSLGGLAPKEGPSDWTDNDFERVANLLSEMCLCTTGGLALTAEFPLAEGAISAIVGHRRTALWRLLGGQPRSRDRRRSFLPAAIAAPNRRQDAVGAGMR